MKCRKDTIIRMRLALANLSIEYMNDLDQAEKEREACEKAKESNELVCIALTGESNAKVTLQCMKDMREAIDFMKDEVEKYKKAAKDAEADFKTKMTQRDQKDWLKGKMDEYDVKSPYARAQLISEIMSEESGLKWKDGAFFGFDDYMKSAKEKDASLYLTAEEKEAAAKKKEQEEKAPNFTGHAGGSGGDGGNKYVPPKLF